MVLRKYLMKHNYKTKKNKYYSFHTLSNILRNPAYTRANKDVIGYLEDTGIEVVGQDRVNDKRAVLVYNKESKQGTMRERKDWIAAVAKHTGGVPADKWVFRIPIRN